MWLPEPSTILMVGAGAASLLRTRLKKGKKLRQE
jgi:PEP-CTERM motif